MGVAFKIGCFKNKTRWAGICAMLGFVLFQTACAQRQPLSATEAAPSTPPSPAAQLNLPRTQLKIGEHIFTVQIASTVQQRQKGLMHRLHMPENEGMLFVFEHAAVQCFWMRNTQLPLTAAFIHADGRIVNLADMQPLDETSHCAHAPVLYVLEMNQGWFQRHGIAAGATVRFGNGQPLSLPTLLQQ